ncbi:MAG TPA: FadR/GntR family transcriptional regulator [Bryobacteraceae bacterium]|nr:FadR/GntR family transcriptional regulator [Bryobacteraceae bacterium]
MREPRQAIKEDITGRLICVFKQMISEGSLVPGERLPPERELAEKFGVSRSSLRQALKVLDVMGVISQRVGDGTYLKAGAPSVLEASMEFLILLDGISFQELMEARALVEPELAARAASRATAADIDELAKVQRAMGQHEDDLEQFVHFDMLFHQTIFRIAGNRVLGMVFTVLHQSIHDLMVTAAPLVHPKRPIQYHDAILTAIRDRNPDAARSEMRAHLTHVSTLITPGAAPVPRPAHERFSPLASLTVQKDTPTPEPQVT